MHVYEYLPSNNYMTAGASSVGPKSQEASRTDVSGKSFALCGSECLLSAARYLLACFGFTKRHRTEASDPAAWRRGKAEEATTRVPARISHRPAKYAR
jgi:hypothetical protein